MGNIGAAPSRAIPTAATSRPCAMRPRKKTDLPACGPHLISGESDIPQAMM
jgi:hypothetical protein